MNRIVVDSSVLLAILLQEEDSDRLVAAILEAPEAVIGAATLVEASAVAVARRGAQAALAIDSLLGALRIQVVPFDENAATHAREAWTRYGRGIGNPAVLNLGDCLSYGTAAALNAPLLYKGDDFSRTDVQSALQP